MFFFYCLTFGLILKGGWDLLIAILALLDLESQFYLVLGCGYTNYLKKSIMLYIKYMSVYVITHIHVFICVIVLLWWTIGFSNIAFLKKVKNLKYALDRKGTRKL